MGSNNAKSSNDFSFETNGQTLMKLGHNDHLKVGIRIYTYKGSCSPKTCTKKFDVQVTVISLGPLV